MGELGRRAGRSERWSERRAHLHLRGQIEGEVCIVVDV